MRIKARKEGFKKKGNNKSDDNSEYLFCRCMQIINLVSDSSDPSPFKSIHTSQHLLEIPKNNPQTNKKTQKINSFAIKNNLRNKKSKKN